MTQRHEVSKCYWKSGAGRLAWCRVAINFVFCFFKVIAVKWGMPVSESSASTLWHVFPPVFGEKWGTTIPGWLMLWELFRPIPWLCHWGHILSLQSGFMLGPPSLWLWTYNSKQIFFSFTWKRVLDWYLRLNYYYYYFWVRTHI